MKKILVPYDFSAYSEYALDFAYHFALHTSAKIKLLHVIEHNVYSDISSQALVTYEQQYRTELIKNSTERFESLKLSEKYPGVEIDFEIRIGIPLHSIIAEITDSQADLIVMGTKGSSGIEELLIGSNAERVVRFAKCPVITIPVETDFKSITDIAFAVNFEDEQPYVVQQLVKVQNQFEAKLHLLWVNTLHVVENEEVILERLENFASKNKLKNFEIHSLRAISPEQGILSFAHENKMDMIAMATHGFKGLTHLFLGSIAENVVNHTKIPVWTFSIKGFKQKD